LRKRYIPRVARVAGGEDTRPRTAINIKHIHLAFLKATSVIPVRGVKQSKENKHLGIEA
jgi:hypothetical protein